MPSLNNILVTEVGKPRSIYTNTIADMTGLTVSDPEDDDALLEMRGLADTKKTPQRQRRAVRRPAGGSATSSCNSKGDNAEFEGEDEMVRSLVDEASILSHATPPRAPKYLFRTPWAVRRMHMHGFS